jgi:hypothetical protein
MNSNFDFSQSLVLEDERVLLYKKRMWSTYWRFRLTNQRLGSILWCAPMVEKIWSTTYICFESTQQQNRFPFIVFDKKNRGVCRKYSFYDMNLDFKTVQLGYTGTAVNLEEQD